MALWTNCQGKWKLANTTYTDDSGNGYTLSATGTPTSAAGHNGGASLATSFSGSGQYLSISDGSCPNLDIAGNAISFSAFIKLSSLSDYRCICAKDGASGQYAYLLYTQVTTGKLTLSLSANGTTYTSVIGTTALSTGVWYHVAGVYNGTDLRVYVNGTLDCTPVAFTSNIFNSNAAFCIAKRDGTASQLMNGVIDDVGVWNRALSASEVQELYFLGDDFVTTPGINGVLRDKAGNAINCSTYNVRVNVYPKNNTVSAPTKSIVVSASDGSWRVGNLANGTKYIATFEYEGKYSPTSERDIAGAEFMTAA